MHQAGDARHASAPFSMHVHGRPILPDRFQIVTWSILTATEPAWWVMRRAVPFCLVHVLVPPQRTVVLRAIWCSR